MVKIISMKPFGFFILFLLIYSCTPRQGQEEFPVDESGKSPYDYVNPFIGTGGDGHTYPGVSVPFGMVQVSPDTDIKHYTQSYGWCAGYRYEDSTIMGFSHTHFSGTGHSDLGDVLIMPTTGKVQIYPGAPDKPAEGYRSRFSHGRESSVPGYYSVFLEDHGIEAELTATTRVGFHRYIYPKADTANIILDLVSSIYYYEGKNIWTVLRVENDTLLTGFRQTRGWADTRYLYFAMAFSKPFTAYGFKKDDSSTYHYRYSPGFLTHTPEVSGKQIRAFISFPTVKDEVVMVKTAISGVSMEGALKNLGEIPHWDFEKVKSRAVHLWKKELSKIIVEGDDREKQIFYTSLYHSMLAPMTYMDVDRKYRGVDQNIHVAGDFTNYTTFSLWDTYRAANPLFTLIQPDVTSGIIKSFLAHQEQSLYKILPVWSFHANETWCMIGYHAVPVIADAYLKGIRNYDVEKAYAAMIASATKRSYDGLGYYMDLGFIPIDEESEAASKVLEYAYDDWTIAQVAKALGKEKDYGDFMKRAGYYRNIFDAGTDFMRAKNSDGSWREPFDPLYSRYGGDYTEGNAWQYSWYVPHDVQGLIGLMGGKERFVEKLDSLFIIHSEDEKYKQVEDISGLIGQYAHGNEPSHHIAYLYDFAGMPWKTQERIHQIMNGLFDNTPYGICGNEDCGQMSAWYIFSSMGFYPVCPGSNTYVIGTPKLRKATITFAQNRRFEMEAHHLSPENYYVQSVTLNGKPLHRSYITHEEIIRGGRLVFEMGNQPDKDWASGAGEVPPSMSKP
jgi:predicted alpha-1,2-mannosidase